MYSRKVIVGCFLVLTLLAGCTRRIADFTVISTKNVSIENMTRAENRVVGEHCVPVFFFPIGAPDLKEAIDNAIEQAGPQYTALVDGVVYYKNKSFIFGTVCFEVEGTPVTTSRSGAFLDEGPDGTPLLYHSRLGLSNDLTRIPFVELTDSTP